MVLIDVVSRSPNLIGLRTDLSIDSKAKLLLDEIVRCNGNKDANRIRLTYKKDDGKQKSQQKQQQIAINLNKSFIDNGFNENDKQITLYIKDLGPQISWRTVFIIEYLGPLIIHPIFYYLSGGPETKTTTQYISFILVMLHFFKREYETIFIHKFSNDTMPVFNIFKNSFHYWVLSGFNLGIFIYFGDTNFSNFFFNVNDFPTPIIIIAVLVWIFAEYSNYKTHVILANLREKDTKKYVIPFGYGFDLVACPNYFFESLAWFSYAMMVGNWSAWFFFFVATGQMFLWAVKKNQRYIKTFGDDYKKLNRKIYVPYVI